MEPPDSITQQALNLTASTPETYLSNYTFPNYGIDSVFGVYDIEDRARIILSRPHRLLAIALAFIAILLNTSSLLALTQVRNRLTTHFRFIISLSLSDIVISSSVVLFVINKILNPAVDSFTASNSERLRSRCLFLAVRSLNTIGLNVTLLNLMGMSIDHYIAVTQPLHYPKILSKCRAKAAILCIWLFAIVCGMSDFLSVFPYMSYLADGYTICDVVYVTHYQEEFTVLAITCICFIAILSLYTRIYCFVRWHQRPGEQAHHPRREACRSTRALRTTLLIICAFSVCWLPNCLFQLTLIIKVKLGLGDIDIGLFHFLVTLDKYLFDLVLLNCILDPVIYTLRTYEVRLGYRRFFRCYNRKWGEYNHVRRVAMRCKFSRGATRQATASAALSSESRVTCNCARCGQRRMSLHGSRVTVGSGHIIH